MSIPNSFYHYCSLDTDARKTWFARIMLQREIYFRSREQLNDPHELRPVLEFDGSDAELRTHAHSVITSHWPTKLSPAKRLREASRLARAYKKSPDGVEKILHELLDGMGLFSVSESPTETLLWGYYASGFRGVCVEFDANCGPFVTAQKVVYADIAPRINRLKDTVDEMLVKSMFTKRIDWQHEREWRVIARPRDDSRIQRYLSQHEIPETAIPFLQNQHGPGYYSVPPDAIRRVLLGSRISGEDAQWVGDVITQSGLPIAIEHT